MPYLGTHCNLFLNKQILLSQTCNIYRFHQILFGTSAISSKMRLHHTVPGLLGSFHALDIHRCVCNYKWLTDTIQVHVHVHSTTYIQCVAPFHSISNSVFFILSQLLSFYTQSKKWKGEFAVLQCRLVTIRIFWIKKKLCWKLTRKI